MVKRRKGKKEDTHLPLLCSLSLDSRLLDAWTPKLFSRFPLFGSSFALLPVSPS